MSREKRVRTVYLVRHAECEDNAAGLIARDDSPLTEAGMVRAADIKETFSRGHGAQVACSPLLRARQTLDGDVDMRLREIDTPLKGRPVAELDADEWIAHPDCVQAEDAGAVADRGADAISSADEVVVSHRAVLVLGALRLMGVPLRRFADVDMPPGHVLSLHLYERDDQERWELGGSAWLKP